MVEFVEPFEDLNIPGDPELNVEYEVDQDWLFLNCHGDVCVSLYYTHEKLKQ